MTATEPYTARLTLTRARDAGSRVFDIYLEDPRVPGIETGEARLDFEEHPWRAFLDAFWRGEVVRHQEAQNFGIELARRLLGQEPIKTSWEQILLRRNNRPLRFEVVLSDELSPEAQAPRVALDEIPFELLADGSGGFWFRRPGWSLVRTFTGLPAMPYRLPPQSRALLAWANPATTHDDGTSSALPQAIFDTHEEEFQREATALGLTALAPCRRATRTALDARMRERPETPLLALVAHGESRGGSVLLHSDETSDEGVGVFARDFATLCRSGGVKVALLWSCHGARRHALRSSVVAAMLHPDVGNVAAVVASHAALVAERTARFVGPLLRSLRDVAGGDLERAVTEARHAAMDEDDIQWAAPVYYARPFEGRSVSLEEAVAQSFAERAPAPLAARRVVLGAPAARSWFRGRADEITRTLGTLQAHRLVTLTGMPGIGKTALAVEVSRRAAEDTLLALEKAFWVDLSAKLDAAALRVDLAVLFGFNPERCPDALSLALAIGATRALVVLDNAEDLLRQDHDAFRKLLDTLLCHATGLRLLVTSRRALGNLDGTEERALPVGRLTRGVDREVFEAVAGERLAEERAGAATTDATVDALVTALDGHPQSIVLVAGQVGRGLPLTALKARVEAQDPEVIRDADLLDEEAEGSDSKLRTRRLVSSLNLSFEPLVRDAPRAAELFAWLAVFPGGLPEMLATHVFGDDATRCVVRLLRLNMVERHGPDRRLTLPGPVRWYASSRQHAVVDGRAVLDAARRQELLARSVRAETGWLAALRAKLGKPGAAEACVRAQDDGANLVALTSAAAEPPTSQTDTVRILAAGFAAYSALASYGDQHQHALTVGEKLRTLFEALGDAASLALVGKELGDLYVRTAMLADAERVYELALPIYRAIDDQLGEANTLQALGDLYVRTDRLADAERVYELALPIYRAIDARLGEANTLRALGDLYVRTARLADAERVYELALPIYRAIDDRLGEANTRKALGDLYVRTARLADAERVYELALPIYRAIDARLGEANTLRALGDLYVRTARLADAERVYELALPIYRAIDARLGEANTRKALGDLYVRTARLADAERVYELALPIYRAIDARLGEANTLQALGDLYVRTARLADAERVYELALPIYRAIDDRLGEANTLRALGDLYVRTDRLADAERVYELALPIYRAIDDRLGEANTLRALGDLYVRTDRLADAERVYELALPIYRTIDARLGEANTLRALGDLYVRTDRLADAERVYELALPSFRAIDDRLGEARTYQGLGNLALARREPKHAFDSYLASFRIQTAIEDSLGLGGTHGYLARAAALAGHIERSIVLGARSFAILLRIHERFGQMLATIDLVNSLAQRKDEGTAAALVFAWATARTIQHPQAQQFEPVIRQLGIDPDTAPLDELREQALASMQETFARYEKILRDRNEDPYSPLEPA